VRESVWITERQCGNQPVRMEELASGNVVLNERECGE
jgi:hypothetical protein